MERGRAYRRHHRERRIKAEYKKWLYIWNDEEWAKNSAVRNHNRRTPCSCAMCGGPRKWFGHQTIPERKAEQDAKEQFDIIDKKFYSRFSNE